MSKWKRCLKLLKYSYSYKLTLLSSVLYLLVAIFMFCASLEVPPSITASVILFYVTFSNLLQLVGNLQYANMVMAAPIRRFMDTWFSDVINGLSAVAAYMIYAIVLVFIIGEGTVDGVSVATILLISSFSIGIFVVFFAICFKYFILGFIVGMILYSFISGIGTVTDVIGGLVNYHNGAAFLLGLVILAVSWILSLGARRLVYKKPMSKYAASAGLRKQL